MYDPVMGQYQPQPRPETKKRKSWMNVWFFLSVIVVTWTIIEIVSFLVTGHAFMPQ